MRWFLPALGVALMATAFNFPADAVGGFVVAGVGWGVSWDSTGTCPSHPFEVNVHFLQEQKAIINFLHAGAAECPLWTGGALMVVQVHFDTTTRPPVWMTYFCTGAETTGLFCFNGAASIAVGPYKGLGVPIPLSMRSAGSNFDGSFLPT